MKPGTDDVRLKKWNWAAFLFAPYWTLANNLDGWFLLLLLPGINIWVLFHLGWKGNRIAYQKSLLPVDDFMIIQRTWNGWVLRMLWIALVILGVGILADYFRE